MDKYKDFQFEIKKEDITADGTFVGYASTFGGKPDSYGDVIEKGAFAETLEAGGKNGLGISMLYQHNSDQPIGVWTELIENNKGLKVKGQLAINTTLGKDVHELLKIGAIRAMSIGWGPRGDDAMEQVGKVRKLKNIDLWEISLVTFPANNRATVTNVKEAIENATTERELEKSLMGYGMTQKAVKYMVSLCKPGLKNLKHNDDYSDILNTLKTINLELELKRAIEQ